MKRIFEFMGATIVGGFFVVLPIVLTILVLSELFEMLGAVVEPLAAIVPVERVVGIEVAALLGILLIVFLCFVTGLALLTGPGAALYAWLERVLLAKIPGWEIVKNLTQRFDPSQNTGVALVRLHGGTSQSIAFVAEELPGGRLAVFVPLAPTPTIGTIYLVDAADVTRLDASAAAALTCVSQWGIGARALLPGG